MSIKLCILGTFCLCFKECVKNLEPIVIARVK